MKRLVLFFLLLINTCMIIHAGHIYVSPQGDDKASGSEYAPFRTLERALKEAREWRRLHRPEVVDGINIWLADGEYEQSTPLFVRPEDSGTSQSPTWISALPGTSPVISGGQRIVNWTPHCEDLRLPLSVQGKIWTADAPWCGNRILEFRQLWVNGKKAQRASMLPEGMLERMIDFNSEECTITIPTPSQSLEHARQLEMIVHQRWAIAVLRVKHMERQGEKTVVRFHEPESYLEFSHPWPQPVINGDKGNSSYTLVNALELLDEPGEWFQEYPSGKVYYYPRADEDMNTAKVVVPALETLLTIDGTLERPVSHVNFKGVSFEYATWMRPSYQGHVTLQGGLYLLDAYKLQIPGLPEKAELENQAWIARPGTAVRVKGASHISFDGCTFQRMASTGLDMEWAVVSSSVENCTFTDIGGTALLVGAFPDGGFETHVPFKPLNMQELCSNIKIHNNLITEVTTEDWGCVGIGAGYVSDMLITHNEVCHVNYSGICVGWGWTSLESGMKNNRIEANYVHDFARILYDAGGLYTLSNQPGSTMKGNRLENLIDSPYATNDRAFYIYFDEATDGYRVEDNWCPEVRFGDNRPGSSLVIGHNGPTVSDSVKNKAGRIR